MAGFRDDSASDAGNAPVVPPIPVLTAIEPSRTDSVERVVFTFRGDVPAYHVAYLADQAEGCGSELPIPVEGSAVLAARFTPADAHEAAGEQVHSSLPRRELAVNFPIIRQIKLTCDFEADVTAAIGLSTRRRFRVTRLDHPTRVVIEVQ